MPAMIKTTLSNRITPLPRPWLCVAAAICLLAAMSSGCSRLRLPAIDPTGSCLFSPLPTTTGLALPGSGGEGCGCLGCISNLGNCFRNPNFQWPEPAFVEPADPPTCPVPSAAAPLNASNEPCVPSAACNGSCLTGPRAVLLGDEIDAGCGCPGKTCAGKCLRSLPDRGNRGCILLSPQKVVAPVGGEVVLLSGICGTDGYLQMNEKLEWMLAPDSVGNFIQIGDDDPGLIGKLVGSSTRPEKRDPSYAIGITSTKRTLITRGNSDPRDDVSLEKGQTWLTISSPSEGVSHVTVLAPDSECWDQRKATTTIYWVDAKWNFPSNQILPAGQHADLTTNVTRTEGGLPAEGWIVRYEIMNPELATFAGTGGSPLVEIPVNASGDATAQLIPVPGTSGTALINMQIIRPGGKLDNVPKLTLGEGQTYVTWSSPKLAIRAGAPEVASFNVPFTVFANVSNPGNQPATGVRVDLPLPPGTTAVAADSFARILPNSVSWEIGTIPAQTQLDLSVDVVSQAPVDLNFTARGDGLVSEDTVRVDVFRPSLSLAVRPLESRVEAGQPVTFHIDIKNTSDRPLTNAKVVVNGDEAMIHESGQSRVEDIKGGGLQPGETWEKEVTYTPTSSGRRCISVEATTDGGQRAVAESCVTAINPIPETPVLTARIDAVDRMAIGQEVTATAQIFNEGRGDATNVRVEMVYDPQLQPIFATEGADQTRLGQNIITWTVPVIKAGSSIPLAGKFQAIRVNPRTAVRVRAVSEEGSSANADLAINVLDAPQPPATSVQPDLPPATPAPSIPGGAAPEPLRGAPQTLPPAGPIGPQRSGRLQTAITGFSNPVRVDESIRYTIRIENDTNVQDSQIDIQLDFPLDQGVKLNRLVPLTNPELGQYEIKNGKVLLPYVPSLAPGEAVEYTVVLSSNQPQTFPLNVLVRSDNIPGGYVETVTTTVLPN